ncbi:Transient receptor putative cation channel subfamily A member 1 [Cichlidogyrus casuarinus]|uniref:Transient receptor putative cation channel subfamily A member 1 n=1 Tax=Cichlidogyrus casuarinus TaxID=1844966 RepID=A0ABD2Q4T1_9PLAT
MAYLGREYWYDWVNYSELIFNGLSFSYGTLRFYGLVYAKTIEIGAFVLFLAWMSLLMQSLRVSFLGIYLVMFMQVLKTVTQCLAVFSVIFIEFGLPMYVLYRVPDSKLLNVTDMEEMAKCFPYYSNFKQNSDNQTTSMGLRSFNNPFHAIFRIVFFMMGEYDSNETIFSPLEDSDPKTMQFPIMTILLIIILLLTVQVVLVNLLIGLAVGDIGAVRKTASIQLIGQQVAWLDGLEPKFPRWMYDRIYTAKYTETRKPIRKQQQSANQNYSSDVSS